VGLTDVTNGIDIMVSADHTFSTSPAIAEVTRSYSDMTRRLARIPNLRMGVIHHGDFDQQNPAAYKLPLTSDFASVQRYLRTIHPSGGMGRGANYAQALRQARIEPWRAGKSRVLIIAGDEIPRPSSHYRGEDAVEADNEIALLDEMKVRRIAVQLLNNRHATPFYRKLAGKSGLHIEIDQMYHLPFLVTGVILFEESPEYFEDYEEELRRRNDFTINIELAFDKIKGRASRKNTRSGGAATTDLVPVHPSRFQMFQVPGEREMTIRDFVQSMGLRFQKGRGFYLHDYREEMVQGNKEIILRDMITGQFFTGDKVRELLGMPAAGPAAGTIKLKPNTLPGYQVWIQSNSVNRTINRDDDAPAGVGRDTWFMYEVDPTA